jgi:hypothetical protein
LHQTCMWIRVGVELPSVIKKSGSSLPSWDRGDDHSLHLLYQKRTRLDRGFVHENELE